LLLATGAIGKAFTTTVVLPNPLVQPFKLTDTLYTPLAKALAFTITGFCALLTKPFGPLHIYTPPSTLLDDNIKVAPAHKAPLFPATGVDGTALITTFVVTTLEVQPPILAVTLYKPLPVAGALLIIGF